MDLAVATHRFNDNGVTVLYGLAGGGYGGRLDIFVDEIAGLAASDFNGDGLADLAVSSEDESSRDGGSISVLYGQPGGGFGGRLDLVIGGDPRGVLAADLNGDGRVDLCIARESMTVLHGLTGGGFGNRLDIPLDYWSEQLTSADFNNDGLADLAVTYGGGTGRRSLACCMACRPVGSVNVRT